MKPINVTKDTESQVWITLFGQDLGEFPLPMYKLGQKVRISKYKSIFTKGYEANFTEEIFFVSKVVRGDPNVYVLSDESGEDIIGKFYEEEMSAVEKTKDATYRVEKVLKKRVVNKKKMVLVKWAGYDNKHNSWIPESDIKSL